MSLSLSRRQIIRTGLLAAAGTSLLGKASASALLSSPKGDVDGTEAWIDFKIGIASYTFRKLSLDDTIKALRRLNLKYISVKDFHLALTSTKAERLTAMQKLKDAGITPLSCGNITMQNDEADVRRAFEYAKDCHMPVIVCSPHPDSMPILDKMVKEYDIKLAIHNHGPEDKRFPSPYDVYKAVQGYDQRIGLCIDVGHTARAKVNPAEAIVKCKDRLYDLHFKDINTTEPNGTTIEAGRGVLDLPAIVKALQKIKYDRLISIEFEGWEADPLPAVAETIGYTNALLAMNGKKKMS
ncbi:MAG: sugar phosphate isomerase/epimerase [Flavisolibacter sp.]|jgi:inosose dehydratase|nr:sugar phosphate isomerase/epimerase [Flavisolibacter sp.]